MLEQWLTRPEAQYLDQFFGVTAPARSRRPASYWDASSRPGEGVFFGSSPLSLRLKLGVLYQLQWLHKLRFTLQLCAGRIPLETRSRLIRALLLCTHAAAVGVGWKFAQARNPPAVEDSARPPLRQRIWSTVKGYSSRIQTALKVLCATTACGFTSWVLWLRFIATPEQTRSSIFGLVGFIARWLHAYKLVGASAVPATGGALVVCYHGFIPSDMYLLPGELYAQTGRLVKVLAADFVFQIPIFGYVARRVGGVPADRGAAMRLLQEGHVVLVSPGGVSEALAGATKDYMLQWGERKGFAEIALAANVPVIPMFTRNIRHVFITFLASTRVVQYLYHLSLIHI
eukprot:TRINITY_DN29514_c0_g1_i2.p1 TRINITY_DN29514_c0_g1~~TRINITY_DN29514_c0_g1_i2.p1  ORF type:complete len:343 (-),score=46.14 TRINITY_DN29514_c0_g1_i2:54-1082(-)